MSIQVLCPACGAVTPFHGPPVVDCPQCRAAYPEQLRRSTEHALAVERAPKPMLLVLGQGFSAFAAAMFLFFMVLAPFDIGSYSIEDQQVSGPEFLRAGGWAMGVMGAMLVAIAIGLWREREWARPLMLFYWLLSTAMIAALSWRGDSGDLASGIVGGVFCTAVAGWYLYAKPNVVAYFRSRAADEKSAPRAA